MIFRSLKMAGFKSFAEAAEVDIESGLTGIVGPNGCGKSNIVEGLRWVMGESSARQMRGGEMDDVIFVMDLVVRSGFSMMNCCYSIFFNDFSIFNLSIYQPMIPTLHSLTNCTLQPG